MPELLSIRHLWPRHTGLDLEHPNRTVKALSKGDPRFEGRPKQHAARQANAGEQHNDPATGSNFQPTHFCF